MRVSVPIQAEPSQGRLKNNRIKWLQRKSDAKNDILYHAFSMSYSFRCH